MGAPTLMSRDINLSTYKKLKMKMLENDFLLTITTEERDKINEMESEFAVDRFCRKIILAHLN